MIEVPGGKFAGYAVVLDPGTSPDGPRPQVLTAERQARRLSVVDFPTPVTAADPAPDPAAVQRRATRRCGATWPPTLRSAHPRPRPAAARAAQRATREPTSRRAPRSRTCARRLREHPCHDCPDREDHARWAERWFKLDRDAKTLERRVEQRTNTVARQFDRVCDVLEALGYLADDDVTDLGRPLRRIYSELDLVVAEALRLGVLDGLGALRAGRGAVDAGLRGPPARGRRLGSGARRRHPAGDRRRWSGCGASSQSVEREHRLDFLRRPDAGLAWAAYRWAEGDDLAEVLDESDLTAGDFVRWIKQLIDLCGQVADAAGDRPLRETARDVVRRIRRGVVAVAPDGGLTHCQLVASSLPGCGPAPGAVTPGDPLPSARVPGPPCRSGPGLRSTAAP